MSPPIPLVTVLMPTYDHQQFIARAIESLLGQSFEDWELLILDDGSPDNTAAVVESYIREPRIRYHRCEKNQGLGAALNCGFDLSRSPYLAYLPSDDVYYRDHLSSLVSILDSEPQTVLAYSGVRHHYNRNAEGKIDGYSLQLVQVLHRRAAGRWLERGELVTDDLERMFWNKLGSAGQFRGTGRVTCEWVDHPGQRHKLLREPEGGINPYRVHFKIKEPLRFHTSVGNRIDEVEHYRRFRERPDTPAAPDGLRILMVGELAYNPERVLALEERGHKLFGLWMPRPHWYNTVGPLPFGHVEDLPSDDWKRAVRKVKPDVIYALLNWQAVPFVHYVMEENPAIPFVWHFKEGPFICLEKGSWTQMVDLYKRSDALIYSSPEMKAWFHTLIPETRDQRALVLDGDLPKSDWFNQPRSPLLSEREGEFHTVVPGRPIGLHPETVAELAKARVHLHFYGDFTHGQWLKWIDRARGLAPGYLHLHNQVDQADWVSEFSQYDAGWLHFFKSENDGEMTRANWDDLNYPARMATCAAAGLPMLQRRNTGAIVATQNLIRDMGLGLFFDNMAELGSQLADQPRMQKIRDNVWRQRQAFTFDYHADRLVNFFRQVAGG